MRRRVTYGFVSYVLFALIMLSWGYLFAQEETNPTELGTAVDTQQSPTVNISGKIICLDCEGERRFGIEVKSFLGPGHPDIASVGIPGPGEYSLKVPQNIGNVYIGAVSFDNNGFAEGHIDTPLVVRDSDIGNIDIKMKFVPLIMSKYQGPTVNISGKVTCLGCEKGKLFRVEARSFAEQGIPDIASVDIPGPGEYSLKVPQNIGNVYVAAICIMPEDKSRPLKGEYDKGNPIKVEDIDISGIDISIE